MNVNTVFGRSMLSTFLSRQPVGKKKQKQERIFSYERDIMCLPNLYRKKMTGNRIPIQRGDHYRQHLAKHGLGSKIMLSSDIDEFQNICRNMMFFFSNSFGHKNFRFQILQPTGGFNKSLTISQVSHQYKWSTSSMAGKKGKVPIIAQEPLKVCSCILYEEFIGSIG